MNKNGTACVLYSSVLFCALFCVVVILAGVGAVVVAAAVVVISLSGVFYRVARTLCPTYGLEPASRSSFQCRL
jgi:hypothetical protein